jgi:hypothetical protein
MMSPNYQPNIVVGDSETKTAGFNYNYENY